MCYQFRLVERFLHFPWAMALRLEQFAITGLTIKVKAQAAAECWKYAAQPTVESASWSTLPFSWRDMRCPTYYGHQIQHSL